MKHKTEYIEALDSLFSVVPPQQLRESLLQVYMNYIIKLDRQLIPEDFTMLSEDIYFLLEFLKQAELIRNREIRFGGNL